MIIEPLGSGLRIPTLLSLGLPFCCFCHMRHVTMVKEVPKARITQWHFSFVGLVGGFWPKADN